MAEVVDFRVGKGETAGDLVGKLAGAGFQASKISEAADIMRQMKADGATVFLALTANMMASGLRGILTQLVDEGHVNAVVTTGGSIDHDIIRSYKPYLLGDYNEDDVRLHKKGVNRIGNILVPNNRYLLLEKKMKRLFIDYHKTKKIFTPVELNDYIGSKLPKDSFLAACHRKKVPVFCPGLIDSAVGMHLFFFRQTHKDFIMDTAEDLHKLSDIIFEAKKTGGIILGGGISKHHVIGSNLLRGGLDYAVYVTTAQEYDGSLSGAHPKEAKSWGKIKEKGRTTTVYGDVTIILPLIMAALK
jgi:deoxyhypusine synthase